MLFNSRSYSILDLIPLDLFPIKISFHHDATARVKNFRSYSITSYSSDFIPPPSLSQYRFYKIFISDIYMNMSSFNLNKIFCKISVGITAFRWKMAAVNLYSQEKFYDNGALAVLRRLAVLSAELPTILEK